MNFKIGKNDKLKVVDLTEMYEKAYVELKKEISIIIKNRIRNSEIIENTFNKILNMPMDKGHELFHLFCEYVMTYNPQLVDNYLLLYSDSFIDDEPKVRRRYGGYGSKH